MKASLAEILQTLQARQEAARARGVELVGVVGSVARGQETAESDVDVVYRRIGHPTLFGLGALLVELEEALGRHVDLIDPAGMKPERWAYMSRDLVQLQ